MDADSDYIITSGKLGYETIQDGVLKVVHCGGLRYWTVV